MKKQESKASKGVVQGLPGLLHPRSWTVQRRQPSALFGGAPGSLQAGKDRLRRGWRVVVGGSHCSHRAEPEQEGKRLKPLSRLRLD